MCLDYMRRASRGGAERQAPQARDPEDQGKASEREGLWRLAGLDEPPASIVSSASRGQDPGLHVSISCGRTV